MEVQRQGGHTEKKFFDLNNLAIVIVTEEVDCWKWTGLQS